MATARNVEPIDPQSPEWRNMLDTSGNALADPAGEIEPEQPMDRVARMLANNSGGRAVVKLYRVRAGKREWCDDYTPAAFEAGGLTAIREQWGAGEYEVQLYGERDLPGGKKHYGIRGRESVEIATPRGIAPGPAASSPELIRVMEALAQGQAAILQSLNTRPEPVPPADPHAQMMQMMQMIKLARDAFAPHTEPRSQISEIVSAMREIREASAELNPNMQPSDPLSEALPGMIDLIGKFAPGAAKAAPATMPLLTLPESLSGAPGAVPEASPSSAQSAPPDNPEGLAVATLKMHLAMLIDMADKAAPVADAANLVYDRAPDEIIDLLAFPNWFTMLGQFEPRVIPHAAWFQSVGAAVAAMIRAEVDEAGPTK
jgi:hypothetical protein